VYGKLTVQDVMYIFKLLHTSSFSLICYVSVVQLNMLSKTGLNIIPS